VARAPAASILVQVQLGAVDDMVADALIGVEQISTDRLEFPAQDVRSTLLRLPQRFSDELLDVLVWINGHLDWDARYDNVDGDVWVAQLVLRMARE
jgi:hypothetical protein